MPKSRSLPASYSTDRRWTDDDARTVLAAQDASGLSVAAFAAREKIDPQRLNFWRRRLGSTAEAAQQATFIEVRSPVGREVVEVVPALRSTYMMRRMSVLVARFDHLRAHSMRLQANTVRWWFLQ